MIVTKLSERTISGLHENLIQSIPTMDYSIPILDIGCGTGAWLERLSGLGFKHLHGVDLDIKQFSSEKATCSQANIDCDALDLSDKKFSLITAIEVIEHLENPGRLIYYVSQHLEKDGYFLLTTPNIHSIHCRLKFLMTAKLASFDEKGDPTHIYPVLLNCLDKILKRYSFQIIKQWGYPSKGTLIYRPSTKFLSDILELFLPNKLSGDTLCLLIKKI